jgi:hypothetical protein
MRGPSVEAFKHGFLKNLILSLGACRGASPGVATMSLHERKRAIKLSADVAMATTRGAGARWPRALLASSTPPPCKVQMCKKIVRRCRHRRTSFCSHARTALAAVSSREIARRLVRKRTKVLRSMIPGGQLLADEVTLLREAMDYVVHLHAQADVLWRVSKATTQRR